ncbi:MAG TPA: hypothetical protein VEC08_05600 [Nitrososphaerales archaeon]|nr:hypothetical protein [Nitrososphaerales archaeon]
MARMQEMTNGSGNGRNQVIVTAGRALGINRFYLAYAIMMGFGVLVFLNPSSSIRITSLISTAGITSGAANAKAAIPLLAVPFTVLPMMMLTTPVVVLFAYDKSNGMLEYLLSLGTTQRDIYLRYLDAALLDAVVYLLFFGALNALYSYIQSGTGGLSTTGVILGTGGLIAVSTVAFIMTVMMIFSSLQKSRAGGNQPLAMTLGLVGVFPGYFIPFLFQYNTAVEVEIVEGALIAAIALVLVALSGRLVRREKLLP